MTTYGERQAKATGTGSGVPVLDVVVLDVYCRISKDYDGTTRSVDSQEEDCLYRLGERAPAWRLGQVHKDHAKSAWNPKVVRPSFEAMMKRLEKGEAQGVLVYDLARFTRKPMEGERLLALAAEGVLVESITTSYNLRTADGRKQFRDAMTAAAFESDKISERTRRGKAKKARKGRSNATRRGFARPGYLPNPADWQQGDPRVPVPADLLARERAAVRDAAARLLAGDSLQGIADEWNAQGLLSVNGEAWSGGRVRDMLCSPALGGLVEHQGQVVAEMGDGPLDRATWERLMLSFDSRRRGRPATAYLLSGLVRCGLCGGRVYGRKMGGRKYADGSPRPAGWQYWCQRKPKNGEGCGKVSVDMGLADSVVEALVVERLDDPREAERVALVRERMLGEQRDLAAELARLEAEADSLVAKLGSSPAWTVARVDAALAQYGALMADTKARLQAVQVLPGTAQPVEDGQAEWDRQPTLALRRALVVRAFPEGLVLHPAATRGPLCMDEQRIHPAGVPVAMGGAA